MSERESKNLEEKFIGLLMKDNRWALPEYGQTNKDLELPSQDH